MADTQPISEGPKPAPKMIRVLFTSGTSSKDMAEQLVKLREEAMKGKRPPKPPE